MLLILISWIYIFFTSLNFGFLFRSLLKIRKCPISIHLVLGLFALAIITTLTSFFIRINLEYYIAILFINGVTTLLYLTPIKLWFKEAFLTFKELKVHHKFLFLCIAIITLAKSATKPYLVDNETYYIQTIKWINEYGFVKGLANTHMFLAQNSAWHILQAAFNFSFISDNLNDLNGFLFTILSLLYIEKLNSNTSRLGIASFNLGLMLLFSLFLQQFVNSPSPDLIIYLIAPYLFYRFTIAYDSLEKDDFKIILGLSIFLCFVKVSIAIILVLSLVLLVKHWTFLKAETALYIGLSSFVVLLFICKNIILSGYPIYPIPQFGMEHLDWKVPNTIMDFFKIDSYLERLMPNTNDHFSFFDRFKFWLLLPKLDGVFNKTYILLLLIFPFFISKQKNKKQLLIIYFLAILQFFILWLSSPQYRFYFVFVAFLGIQIFSFIIKSKTIKNYAVFLAVVCSAIPIFIPFELKTFTDNTLANNISVFSIRNIIIPEKNTKTMTTFTEYNIDGFMFYSPEENVFFWTTGNGNLPCVNKKQIDYFNTYYNYIPEWRSENLKDGFRSKRTN
ncbi:LIC_10190 family membrane protein [Algibacter mikhailovii]|uniref:LIC_10190 family membrane protein n=1 Tax=Algibacter mikhailovii TaxID=425498 RepID=UPI003F72488B